MKPSAAPIILIASIVLSLIGLYGLLDQAAKSQSARDILAKSLAQSRAALDSASIREQLVRDSAEVREQERDAAWSNHVRELQAQSQAEIQAAAHASADRARREVEAKLGFNLKLLNESPAVDSSSCRVTMLCTEVVAWEASDSLHRVQMDSASSWSKVQAQACSTKVASVHVERDSVCVSLEPATVPPAPWWKTAQVLVVVAALSSLAGAVAAN